MITAIYDGQCVICNASRRVVRALDWGRRVEFLDLHNATAIAHRYPDLDYAAAMGQVHVLDEHARTIADSYGGFFGARRMMRETPLLWPLYGLLHLPGMTAIGQRVYRFIAAHRYEINRRFGVEICDDGACVIPVDRLPAKS